MITDTDWMLKASCREWAQGVFFWDDGSRGPDPAKTAKAKGICYSCPVRRPCLEYALEHEQAGKTYLGMAHLAWRTFDANHNHIGYRFKWGPFTASSTPAHGVWGGFTAKERHRKDVKHIVVLGDTCIRGRKCSGCRDPHEWAGQLLDEERGTYERSPSPAL